MALHGHTKIELQDVNTGEKKVIEDDNMVTNGLSKMLRPANGWANVFGSRRFYPKDNYLSMIDNLFGGIVCFEKTHEENPENFFRDPLNKIIAKASTYAYTGLDKTQGSYNIEESGVQQDGSFKKVWDFSTNQGNGTIASVSLSTQYYGELGDGCIVEDELNKVSGNTYTFDVMKAVGIGGFFNSASTDGYIPTANLTKSVGNWTASNYAVANEMFCYADYVDNYTIFLDNAYNVFYNSSYKNDFFYNTKKICLRKMHVPFSKISPLTNPYDLIVDSEGIEIAIPDSILEQCKGTYDCLFVHSDIGYIYIVMVKNDHVVKPGEILRVLKINVSDFVTEVMSITNTTPTNIYFRGGESTSSVKSINNGYGTGGISITNEYFIFLSASDNNVETDKKIYRINLKNNADITVFKMNGEDYKSKSNRRLFQRIGDMLYSGDLALNIKSTEVKYNKISGNTYYEWLSESSISTPFEAYGERVPVFYKFISPARANEPYLALQPCFRIDTLMTINNLPEPVIKTASQTMKITYTITEE